MSNHYEAGKGSKQRPTDINKFSEGWDRVFKNEYQDVLSTEDCVIDAFKTLEEEKSNKLSEVKK